MKILILFIALSFLVGCGFKETQTGYIYEDIGAPGIKREIVCYDSQFDGNHTCRIRFTR